METKELKLMSFLGWLHDETSNEFVKIPLCEKLKEYNVPQDSITGSRIVELGILEKKKDGSGYLYKWKIEEGPSVAMVQNIIDATAEYWRNKPKASPKIKKPPILKDKLIGFDPVPDTSAEIKQVLAGAKKIDQKIFEKNVELQAIALEVNLEDIASICRLKGITGQITESKTIIL